MNKYSCAFVSTPDNPLLNRNIQTHNSMILHIIFILKTEKRCYHKCITLGKLKKNKTLYLWHLFWMHAAAMFFFRVLSILYHCLEYTAKPNLQGLTYSSLCRLCTRWRSHNPQTDLNSSRKALDPKSTHFLQTTQPKREGVFGHAWNPWLKSATSGHRRVCGCAHTTRYDKRMRT